MDQLRDCVFGGCQDIDTASPRVKNEHLKMYFSVAHFVLMAYLMEKKDTARKNLDTLQINEIKIESVFKKPKSPAKPKSTKVTRQKSPPKTQRHKSTPKRQ